MTRCRHVTHQASGKSGISNTTHGLRIACLGGIYDPSNYSSSPEDAPPVGSIFLFLEDIHDS
jgi:hypothetical protein